VDSLTQYHENILLQAVLLFTYSKTYRTGIWAQFACLVALLAHQAFESLVHACSLVFSVP